MPVFELTMLGMFLVQIKASDSDLVTEVKVCVPAYFLRVCM